MKMSMPYAYIQYSNDGKAWLFLDDDPIVPIRKNIGQTICDRINADRDALLLARFAHTGRSKDSATRRIDHFVDPNTKEMT